MKKEYIYAIIAILVVFSLLVGGVIYLLRRKKSQKNYIKFEGTNNDIVWIADIKKMVGKTLEIVVPYSHEVILLRDGVLEKLNTGRHQIKRDLSLKESDIQVYYVNKTLDIPVKWGTPTGFHTIDPLLKVPIVVGSSGEMIINVADAEIFMTKLIGMSMGMDTSQFSTFFRGKISQEVVESLSNHMNESNLSYLQISRYMKGMSKLVMEEMANSVLKYGIKLADFIISTVKIPDDVIVEYTKDKTLARKLEERDMTYKEMLEMSKSDMKSQQDFELSVIKALQKKPDQIGVFNIKAEKSEE